MGEGQPASPDELLTQKPSNDLRSHGVAVHDGGVDQHDRPLVQQKAAAKSDQAPEGVAAPVATGECGGSATADVPTAITTAKASDKGSIGYPRNPTPAA